MPRPLPLGEVDLRSKDGEGEDANRSAALSQKAALQMPFASTTPPVKMRLERSAERDKREIKIIFPLKMARAQAEALANRLHLPVELQSIRSRQRLPLRGSWQSRQALTEGVGRPLGEGGCERSEQTEGVSPPAAYRLIYQFVAFCGGY